MESRIALLLLVSAILVTSGCLNGEDPETPEGELDQPEPDESVEEEDDEDSETSDAENGEDVRQIVIEGGEHYFDSDNVEVEQGETVEIVFANTGDMQHDLRIPDLDEGTEVISSGERDSFEVTFDEEGEYDFECSVSGHAEQGMEGTITVR